MEPVNGLPSCYSGCARVQVSSSGNLEDYVCVIHALTCALELRSHPLTGQQKTLHKGGFFRMEPVNGFEPLTY